MALQMSGGRHGNTLRVFVKAATPGEELALRIWAACMQQQRAFGIAEMTKASMQASKLLQAPTGHASEGTRLSSCCFLHQGGDCRARDVPC